MHYTGIVDSNIPPHNNNYMVERSGGRKVSCGPSEKAAEDELLRAILEAAKDGETVVRIRLPDQVVHLEPGDIPHHVIKQASNKMGTADRTRPRTKEEGNEAVYAHNTKSTYRKGNVVPPRMTIRRSAPEPDQRRHDKRRRVGVFNCGHAAGEEGGHSSIEEFSSEEDEDEAK